MIVIIAIVRIAVFRNSDKTTGGEKQKMIINKNQWEMADNNKVI